METSQTQPERWYNGWLTPVIFTLVLAAAIQKGGRYWFDYHLPMTMIWVLYFGLYFALSKLLRRKPAGGKAEPHPAEGWPLPGPLKRWQFFLTFVTSVLLSLLNPFLLFQQLRQTIGQAKLRAPANGDYQTKVNYRLPLEGEWLVYHGGHTQQTSHSWDALTQRYAYDFVKADKQFSRHEGRGRQPTDYYCHGQSILAAADGEVVGLMDGIGESPFAGLFMVDFLCRNMAGNHLMIRHADGEYGFYAHLLKDSLAVNVGDQVKQGQVIGLCGFSGNGTEPHLHFHLQDKPNFYRGMGLPIKFEQVTVDGQPETGPVVVVRGTRVASLVSQIGAPS
jgi:hypothetical protein